MITLNVLDGISAGATSIQRKSFQAAAVSILLYDSTTLMKRSEKKRDRNCIRMLRAVLKKS